jgi:acyl-CoA dehydrogenase family protein 9
MMNESFLEGIYRGSLDKEVFESVKVSVDVGKVDSLKNQVSEILKDYPAQTIEAAGKVPEEMLKEMGRIGLFGISIPQAYGGLGFNTWEYLRLVEEIAKMDISMVLVSLAHLSIGVKGITLFGSVAQKQKYLPPAASGEMIFSYALTEPSVGSDSRHIETRAELSEDGTHYILNGRKTYITNANYAGGLTVFAQMDSKRPGFMGAFIVEPAWDGVTIGKDMPKMGLKCSSTAPIQLKDVRVPRENLLGEPGDGFKIAMSILNYGRLGLGAVSVGMMDQSLSDMIKRSSTRMQFGVPISSFPLIQEKMTAAGAHSLAASAMDEFTAGLLERNPTANVAIESSHCKLFGTTRGWDTLYDALQTAGGAGYLSTLPYEKRMRDFRVTTVFEGTTEIHSIYPPLFAMRKIQKEMAASSRSWFSRMWLLLSAPFRRVEWPVSYKESTMRKASKLAKANARTIRRMLFFGLLLHGKKASEKEFFLRRITTLSVYMFALLAILARADKNGGNGLPRKEDIALLGYLIEEAKEARKQNKRLLDSKREKLHASIVQGFIREKAGNVESGQTSPRLSPS